MSGGVSAAFDQREAPRDSCCLSWRHWSERKANRVDVFMVLMNAGYKSIVHSI